MKRKLRYTSRSLAARAAALGCLFSLIGCGVCAQDAPADEPLIAEAGYSVALMDAGVDEADAERLQTRRERDDREDVVEIEFYYDNNEYEYTIRCEDGMILEWQVEGRNVNDAQAELSLQRADSGADTAANSASGADDVSGDAANGAADNTAGNAADNTADGQKSGTAADGAVITADGTVLIGLARAKEIVQNEIGSADLEFTKIHFELDGKRFYEYEFEFYDGRREYECTVDAETGDLIHLEMDD